MSRTTSMSWNRAAAIAIAWLVAIVAIGAIANTVASEQIGYYIGYLLPAIGLGLALLTRFIHHTWRIPLMMYAIGVIGGVGISLLGLALARS